MVGEVAALLPPLVQLEFEGRYAAMLSHEPKNYALLTYEGLLVLRGVAFRSSRAEPFAETFLRRAVERLLNGDIVGVREAYLASVTALHRRDLPTRDVSSRVRLTKTPAEYLASRAERRELPYEAMLASGRSTWTAGERVRVYRTASGYGRLVEDPDEDDGGPERLDPRDYDSDTTSGSSAYLRHAVVRAHASRLRRCVRRSEPTLALPGVARNDARGAHSWRLSRSRACGRTWRPSVARWRCSRSRRVWYSPPAGMLGLF